MLSSELVIGEDVHCRCTVVISHINTRGRDANSGQDRETRAFDGAVEVVQAQVVLQLRDSGLLNYKYRHTQTHTDTHTHI